MSTEEKWILGGLALLGLAATFGAAESGGGNSLSAPVFPLKIRVDSLGDGHYGSSRGDHIHQGIDLETTAGEMVRSPTAGTVTRTFYAYQDSTRWTGVEIKTPSGNRIKIMYIVPSVGANTPVQVGTPIGVAQPIHERYGSAMRDHIHVEVWTPEGYTIDPAPLFGLA